MNEISPDIVLGILKNYQFRNKTIDLLVSGIVSGVVVKDRVISFVADLSSQDHDFIKPLIEQVRSDLLGISGIENVKITFTQHQEVQNKVIEKTKIQLPGVKKIILVSSGKGGVGKSTITFFLAQYLRSKNYKVGILDADIYGPSIATLARCPNKPEIEDGIMIPYSYNGIKINSIGYLIPEGQALIWRGPMISKSLHQLLYGTKWRDLDYLLIDMPPGTGDIHLTLADKYQLSGSLIISTPQELSIADVSRAMNMYSKLKLPILGIIENMAFFESNEKNIEIFGSDKLLEDLAKQYDSKIIAKIPIKSQICYDDVDLEVFANICKAIE